MATFDQLAADQRAIIEIVLKQGRTYEEIGEMLDLPPSRVRELARDALVELAPFTADFVDPQWRGQLADYVLGQQSGPESQATRGHLRRSEPARIWSYSLLDALDDFYESGQRPDIPVGEAGAATRPRGLRDREARANGEGPAIGAVGATARAPRSSLSPAARSALMRRQVAAGAGVVVAIALLVFGATKIFGGGDDNKKKASAKTATTASAAQGQGQIVAQAVLAPVGGVKGQGAALVYQNGKNALAVVRATVPATSGSDKYVLWLYNSEKQSVPLAADVSDKQGNFQGAAALPSGWQNYRFFDLTRQPTTGKSVKHGRSVLRGPLTSPSTGAATGTGTGSTTGTGTGTTTTP